MHERATHGRTDRSLCLRNKNGTKKSEAGAGLKTNIICEVGMNEMRAPTNEEIRAQVLDDEEFTLIDSMDDDAEWHLITQLRMFSVRERRLMQRIRQYKEVDEKNHGLAVQSVSKKKVLEDVVNAEEESIGDGKLKKSREMTVTNTEVVINSIMALEAKLTKVQRAKTKAIESLTKIRLERPFVSRGRFFVPVS